MPGDATVVKGSGGSRGAFVPGDVVQHGDGSIYVIASDGYGDAIWEAQEDAKVNGWRLPPYLHTSCRFLVRCRDAKI